MANRYTNKYSWPGPGPRVEERGGGSVGLYPAEVHPPAPWPTPGKSSEDERSSDLKSIVSQAQDFVRSLSTLVNDANKLRVESVSLRHENEGLAADNQRLQREAEVLEGKLALLEERVAKLEQTPTPDLTEGLSETLPPNRDDLKKHFLARLSLTPRDWYLDDAGYPVRDEFVTVSGKKGVVTFTPTQAVYYMETGEAPRTLTGNVFPDEAERITARQLGLAAVVLTEDDLPAIKKACGLRE